MALRIQKSRLAQGIVLLLAISTQRQLGLAQNPGNPASSPKRSTIRSIRFLPELLPIHVKEFLELLPFQVGDPFDEDNLRAAMQALFNSNRFLNLEVEKTETENQVDILFRGALSLFVGNVSVDGAPGTTERGELVSAAKLQLGSLFDEASLNQSVESIEAELRLEGFYGSDVKYALERDPLHSLVNIHFFIDHGPRARLQKPVLRGTLLFPEEKLVNASRWRNPWYKPGWRSVNESRIQAGVRKLRDLYVKQNRLMSKVQLERLEIDGSGLLATPNLRINPGPKIALKTEGIELSKSTLRRLIPIFEEQSVDKDLLVEGMQDTSAYLRSRGYFDNRVSFRIEQEGQVVEEVDPAKDAEILLKVELGSRMKVRRIRIEGNRYFDEKTIRERMIVRPATILRYRQGKFSDELLEGDKNALLELYRANGFLDAKITSSVNKQGKQAIQEVEVLIRIEENTQSLIEDFRLEGVSESDQDILMPYVSSLQGQPFSQLTIQADRDRILSLLYQNGYASATFESIIERNPASGGIRLRYLIQGGPQNFVREVIITGLKSTNRSLVAKRISLIANEPLNNNEIFAAQRKLYDLGIFARVDTAIQNPEGSTKAKTVLFNLEEASRWSFNGGLGAEVARIGGRFTSLDSPAGGTGFSPRVSFGASRANFLGLGHTVSAQTRLSNIQERVLLTYLAPQFRDSERFALTLTALYDDARNVRTFNSKRLEGSLQLSNRIDVSQTLQYRFTYRDVRIAADTIKIDPSLIPLLIQPVRVGIFSSTYIQDRRDDPLDAKRGRYTTVDFGVASRQIASSASFLRLIARNSSYYKLKRDIVFARSLTFGLLSPFGATSRQDPATNIPLAERFFSGGANSHRGFPENQAGPRDLITGFPIGGKATFTNNLELRFPLIGDSLGGVIFHDAGNVYSGASKISVRWSQRDLKDFDYMVHAFGVGFRYRTPIGPVRLDLAFSPNSARFNGFVGSREDLLFGRGRETSLRVNQFQFHISLGQAF